MFIAYSIIGPSLLADMGNPEFDRVTITRGCVGNRKAALSRQLNEEPVPQITGPAFSLLAVRNGQSHRKGLELLTTREWKVLAIARRRRGVDEVSVRRVLRVRLIKRRDGDRLGVEGENHDCQQAAHYQAQQRQLRFDTGHVDQLLLPGCMSLIARLDFSQERSPASSTSCSRR
ncbi:hypothetical protein D3C80_1448640 [compost metagenome]